MILCRWKWRKNWTDWSLGDPGGRGTRLRRCNVGFSRLCKRTPSQKLLTFISGIERNWFDGMAKGSATKSIDESNESDDVGYSNCRLKNSSAAKSQSIDDPGLEDEENRTRPPSRVSPSNSSSETLKLTLDWDPLVDPDRSTTTIFSTLFVSLFLLFFFTGGGGYVHSLPPRVQRSQIGLTSSHYPGQRRSIY